MIKNTTLLLCLLMGFSFTSLSGESEPMTGRALESIIREFSEEEIHVSGNVIAFAYQNVLLHCIYDESHNRMRIISAIKEYSEVTEEQKDRMMESNFHGALDARYAESGGVLYAAYIHPLAPLKKGDVLSGIYQVASLYLSFGTQYSSGLLTFGGEKTEEPDDQI